MPSIYQNIQTDKQYKASTGLKISEFEQLFAVFQNLYIPKEGNPYLTNTKPVLTDKREALFFILFYFKTYPTLVNLGICFGFSEFTASHYLDLIKPILKAALKGNNELIIGTFKTQNQFDETFKNVNEIFIDVTEIPIERPSDKEIQVNKYSGKKNFIP
jgi:hypothetical protein